MIIKNNIHNIYMDNKNFRRVSDTNPIIRANYAKLFPRPRTNYFVEELRRRNREKERENMSKEDFPVFEEQNTGILPIVGTIEERIPELSIGGGFSRSNRVVPSRYDSIQIEPYLSRYGNNSEIERLINLFQKYGKNFREYAKNYNKSYVDSVIIDLENRNENNCLDENCIIS